jgi:heat-inducible transcriptional repressor
MRETPEYEALDERTRSILIAVVRNFIQTADPVCSRTISKRYNFGLSPATIRNVMSDLEDLGFLEQPHTSAGRVPTDKGYRCYVDHLHTVEIPSPEEAELISQRYRLNHGDTDEVISTTSQLLSEISRYASVVLCTFSTAIFKRIEFVKIRDKQVLAIFVMDSAIVHNKLIVLDEEMTQDELHKISNYLNREFSGQPLHTIRQRVLERMTEEKAQYDLLVQQAINVGVKTFEDAIEAEGDIYLGGTSNIIDQPEFTANVDRMKELFKAFEEKNRLIGILDRCLDATGINVIIGSETPFRDIQECSFVTHTYTYDDRTMGVLGVVGPKRMEYPRMMALVDYTAALVSQILTTGREFR